MCGATSDVRFGPESRPQQIATENGEEVRIVLSPATKAYLDQKYDASTPIGLEWAGPTDTRDAYSWDPGSHVPGIPPARMMAQISRRVEGRAPIVVDIQMAHTIGGVEGAVLAGFVHEVVALRRQSAPEEISLRDSDLEVLATASGRRAEQFMEAVEPALRRP